MLLMFVELVINDIVAISRKHVFEMNGGGVGGVVKSKKDKRFEIIQ